MVILFSSSPVLQRYDTAPGVAVADALIVISDPAHIVCVTGMAFDKTGTLGRLTVTVTALAPDVIVFVVFLYIVNRAKPFSVLPVIVLLPDVAGIEALPAISEQPYSDSVFKKPEPPPPLASLCAPPP